MQDSIKELLVYLQTKGLTENVYSAFHLLSFFAAIPVFLWLAKKMDVGRVRAFFALLATCVAFLVMIHLIGYIEASLGLGNFGRKNAVTIYIWIPLICFGVSKMTKISWGKLCTMMAPMIMFIHGIAHMGCLFAGCCKGFECSWGIYNIYAKNFRFPMPLVEGCWKVTFSFVLLYVLKRRGYKYTSWLYPLMLLVAGSVTFITEFFVDNAKIWGDWSVRSFHSVSMFIVGLVWLWVIFEKWTKEKERKNRFKKPKQKAV